MGRKSVQKKLECFLKMFAAVKGPQQLYKHHVLLQMFIGFLSNPDPKLANIAFMCVQKFKLSYIMPYIDPLQSMLKKDELRDALAKFDLSIDSDSVDTEHRDSLIPIVTRILFGRFSSRGSGGKSKSAKDSPAARRAAILSFFSRIGNSHGELTYFIYMMTRAFIPSRYTNRKLEDGNESLTEAIAYLNSITPEDTRKVPVQRQIGFLNLLSDVINQIGFGVRDVVPVFMNLLLTMSAEAQNALIVSTENLSSKMETDADGESSDELENEGSQIGRVRTLTFLRLGDLLTKFASSIDFSGYGDRMWETMSCSLLALPSTVINADRPPSLLKLIESISAHPKLIPLLNKSKDVIPCVFKCISGTTRFKVMDSVLHIIDNLLSSQDDEGYIGQYMILDHIHLIISQFNERLMSKITKSDTREDIKDYSEGGQRFSSSEALQLNILCRVSELLLNDTTSSNKDDIETMGNLCGLLIPSLSFSTHPNQVHLMRIVANFMPRISAESAKSHYHALSKVKFCYKQFALLASHTRLITFYLLVICKSCLDQTNSIQECHQVRCAKSFPPP